MNRFLKPQYPNTVVKSKKGSSLAKFKPYTEALHYGIEVKNTGAK